MSLHREGYSMVDCPTVSLVDCPMVSSGGCSMASWVVSWTGCSVRSAVMVGLEQRAARQDSVERAEKVVSGEPDSQR